MTAAVAHSDRLSMPWHAMCLTARRLPVLPCNLFAQTPATPAPPPAIDYPGEDATPGRAEAMTFGIRKNLPAKEVLLRLEGDCRKPAAFFADKLFGPGVSGQPGGMDDRQLAELMALPATRHVTTKDAAMEYLSHDANLLVCPPHPTTFPPPGHRCLSAWWLQALKEKYASVLLGYVTNRPAITDVPKHIKTWHQGSQ